MRLRQPGGGRSPRASYYQGGVVNTATRPFERRQPPTRNLAKLADILILVAATLALAYGLAVNPDPSVIADSSAYHASVDYKAVAQKSFSAVKDRTKITFDEQAAITDLEKQFPEISNATVELPIFSQHPTLRLTISKPAYILSGATGSFVVDSEGVAVAPAASLPAVKNLLKIDDQSGYKIAAGTRVLSSDSINFINNVVVQAKQAKVPIASLTLPPAAEELDLRTADKNYFVKFYLGGDALLQSGQFLAARHQFASSHQDPSTYLDVRVAGKIFYK